MKIEKVILKNFRAYKEKTEIEIGDLTVFVGRNDIGKSTVLEALDIFFNGSSKDATVKLEKEDLNKEAERNGEDKILIGVVFSDFPEQIIIDSNVPTSLREEFLLNKKGLLEIHKIYKKGKLETRLVCEHPANKKLKDLLLLTIQELKERAEELNIDLSNVNKTISSEIR